MKAAYLIVAHNNPDQLRTLVGLLDYEDNDIFVHLDRKFTGITSEELTSCVSCAGINVYSIYDVRWGERTLTECEIFLIGKALENGPYDYYHVISGQDLPLKSHEEINSFFEANAGKEFVHFESREFSDKEMYIYYRFWRESRKTGLTAKLDRISLKLQKRLGVHRNFHCGSNWFSITERLARDYYDHRKKVLRRISRMTASDECALQTFILDMSKETYSFYKQSFDHEDYSTVARYIDWKRGTPYVWRTGDIDELMTSGAMFARKFDEKTDNDIIMMIADRVGRKGAEL